MWTGCLKRLLRCLIWTIWQTTLCQILINRLSAGNGRSYRTRLAFSNLAIRRIYLPSRVLADRDTALWVIGHELGHFMIRDGIEGHAEFAAERIHWRARQRC
jgi:hypothetical protein